MLNLAEKFAKAKGTRVIAHRMDGEQIVFVLEAGPKLRMTEAELKQALAEIQKPVPDLAVAQFAPSKPARVRAPKSEKE